MKHFIKKAVIGQAPEPAHFDPGILPELEALYAALLPTLEKKRPFIFISANSNGEGVSTVAWALSYYIAMREREECLYVDGDISFPSIRTNDEMPEPGLGEFLGGDVDFKLLPFQTELNSLAAVHGGRMQGKYVNLSEERVQNFASEATRYYRAAVFNGRPGFDKFNEIWAKHSDVVLIVSSYRSTKREILQQTLRGYKLAGIKVTGLIFNKQEHPIPDLIYRRL